MKLFLVVLLALVSQSACSGQHKKTGTFLGAADGKRFFAEISVRKNWKHAKAHCESMGMSLVSITSAAQGRVLKNFAKTQEFYGYFWTAGKDSQELRQFSWDGSNTAPKSILEADLIFDVNESETNTCLMYYANNGSNNKRYHSTSCTNTDVGVMCQD